MAKAKSENTVPTVETATPPAPPAGKIIQAEAKFEITSDFVSKASVLNKAEAALEIASDLTGKALVLDQALVAEGADREAAKASLKRNTEKAQDATRLMSYATELIDHLDQIPPPPTFTNLSLQPKRRGCRGNKDWNQTTARRLTTGAVEPVDDGLTAFARLLRELWQRENPGRKPSALGTVKNNVREIYDEALKQRTK